MPKEQKTLPKSVQKIANLYGEDKCVEAYDLSIEGRPNHEIANEIEVGVNAVDALVSAGQKIEEVRQANRPETNIEFVTRIMDYAKVGPVMQVLVIQALDQYSKAVTAKSVDELRVQFGEGSMIGPEAWHAAATEMSQEIEARLK